MDATVRFLDELPYQEKSLLTQQHMRQAPGGKAMGDEEDKEVNGGVNPFMPTYVCDAMKGKRQFINVGVRIFTRVIEICY
jgi:hypothetical protein